ncbi:MAG TPA: helix-turn-helix domain-containing protein [Anaerolineae bacterium]|nr:helix-turn-helix domain-containing protein [Anaerolineae bacterium]HID83590.1 helix-turn-helix domain-containing protein [Anaerolineales bacterium]
MPMYEREAISINVGSRLRKLREERGLSLRALARASGLSANALSMIERGLSSPSVSTLYKLATALHVPITAFFRETIEKREVVFIHRDERLRLSFARGVWEDLGGDRYQGPISPTLLTLEVGGTSGPFPMSHTGHEFVFCLRGELEYEIADRSYRLQAGDVLLFSARLPHRWRNVGSTVVNVLILVAGFAEEERPADLHYHAFAAEAPIEMAEGQVDQEGEAASSEPEEGSKEA